MTTTTDKSTTDVSTTDVSFQIQFKGDASNPPTLTYDKDQGQFSLKNGPLAVGTLEDIGTSVADFFGGHFPDTSGIPVISTLMNKLQFNIKTFQYTEKSSTKSDGFDLEIDTVPTNDSMKIGLAEVTSIDISISKPQQDISA